MHSPLLRWPGAGWWSLVGEPASLWVPPRGGICVGGPPGVWALPIPVRLRPMGFYPRGLTGRLPTTNKNKNPAGMSPISGPEALLRNIG